jgi:hypothetical protein
LPRSRPGGHHHILAPRHARHRATPPQHRHPDAPDRNPPRSTVARTSRAPTLSSKMEGKAGRYRRRRPGFTRRPLPATAAEGGGGGRGGGWRLEFIPSPLGGGARGERFGKDSIYRAALGSFTGHPAYFLAGNTSKQRAPQVFSILGHLQRADPNRSVLVRLRRAIDRIWVMVRASPAKLSSGRSRQTHPVHRSY